MGRLGPSVVVRQQQLLLSAGIAVVALSLLALHQLSVNHTVADPSSGSAAAAAAVINQHERVGDELDDNAHLVATLDQHPGSPDDGCPGCAGHDVMALTCLAALIFVAIGCTLSGPIASRGVRLRRLLLRRLLEPRGWRPPRLSVLELSISRT